MSGCADRGDDFGDEDLEVRGGQSNASFWDWHPNDPANGPIEVHEGTDADVPDCIIWDIDTANVARQVMLGEFTNVASIDDNEVFDIDPQTGQAGTLQCAGVVSEDAWPFKTFQMLNGDGSTALTVWNNFVFMGDITVPPLGSAQLGSLLQNDVAFSFKKDHIYAGPWWDGSIVATTDVDLKKANPMRRMLLGALVAGECGSNGLP